jgi:hypothetical protein
MIKKYHPEMWIRTQMIRAVSGRSSLSGPETPSQIEISFINVILSHERGSSYSTLRQ